VVGHVRLWLSELPVAQKQLLSDLSQNWTTERRHREDFLIVSRLKRVLKTCVRVQQGLVAPQVRRAGSPVRQQGWQRQWPRQRGARAQSGTWEAGPGSETVTRARHSTATTAQISDRAGLSQARDLSPQVWVQARMTGRGRQEPRHSFCPAPGGPTVKPQLKSSSQGSEGAGTRLRLSEPKLVSVKEPTLDPAS